MRCVQAAQALEVACWGGLLRARRCVLAGDHLQLPPTVISERAATLGLSCTLFERLHALYGDAVAQMLTVQYRMHAGIMQWASDALYNGLLTAHASVAAHTVEGLSGYTGGVDADDVAALVLVDTAGCDMEEAAEEEGGSRYNVGEAACAVALVKQLLAQGLGVQDVGIITPYSAQSAHVRSALAVEGLKVEVSTVDGFQGREKEVVIISMVRSNKKGGVGFLADKRRMNVAVTRARRRCVLVCDSETVSHDPFLQGLIAHFEASAVYISAAELIP